MRELRLGIAQITARGEAAESRALTLEAAGELFGRGARLVVLPELIVPGYHLDRDFLKAGAEPLDGPTVRSWRELAAKTDGYLAGGLCERDGETLYNTA